MRKRLEFVKLSISLAVAFSAGGCGGFSSKIGEIEQVEIASGSAQSGVTSLTGLQGLHSNETEIIRVLVVHGINQHCIGYGTNLIQGIAKSIGYTYAGNGPEDFWPAKCDASTGDLRTGATQTRLPSFGVIADILIAPLRQTVRNALSNRPKYRPSVSKQREKCRRDGENCAEIPLPPSLASAAELQNRISPDLGFGFIRTVDYVRKQFESKKTTILRFYEVTWDPLTRWIKKDYLYGDSDELRAKRQFPSNVLKADLINSGFSDAVLYLGKYRQQMQVPILAAICKTIMDTELQVKSGIVVSSHDQTKLSKNPDQNHLNCRLGELSKSKPNFSREFPSKNKIAIITHSLGTRMVFDTLGRMSSPIELRKLIQSYESSDCLGKNPANKKCIGGFDDIWRAADVFRKSVAQIYNFANQVPLLELGTIDETTVLEKLKVSKDNKYGPYKWEPGVNFGRFLEFRANSSDAIELGSVISGIQGVIPILNCAGEFLRFGKNYLQSKNAMQALRNCRNPIDRQISTSTHSISKPNYEKALRLIGACSFGKDEIEIFECLKTLKKFEIVLDQAARTLEVLRNAVNSNQAFLAPISTTQARFNPCEVAYWELQIKRLNSPKTGSGTNFDNVRESRAAQRINLRLLKNARSSARLARKAIRRSPWACSIARDVQAFPKLGQSTRQLAPNFASTLRLLISDQIESIASLEKPLNRITNHLIYRNLDPLVIFSFNDDNDLLSYDLRQWYKRGYEYKATGGIARSQELGSQAVKLEPQGADFQHMKYVAIDVDFSKITVSGGTLANPLVAHSNYFGAPIIFRFVACGYDVSTSTRHGRLKNQAATKRC